MSEKENKSDGTWKAAIAVPLAAIAGIAAFSFLCLGYAQLAGLYNSYARQYNDYLRQQKAAIVRLAEPVEQKQAISNIVEREISDIVTE